MRPSFGLPVGSSLVLIGLLSSAILSHSFLIYVEAILSYGNLGGFGRTLTACVLSVSAFNLILFWIGVVRKGDQNSLTVWALILITLSIFNTILTSIDLYFVRTIRPLYWRSVWGLLVANLFDIYVISVACYGVNRKWTPSSGSTNPCQSSNDNPLNPIGSGWKDIFSFYKKNIDLALKLVLMLDITHSTLSLLISKIPVHTELLVSGNSLVIGNDLTEIVDSSNSLIKVIDDIYLRIVRVLLNIIAFRFVGSEFEYATTKRNFLKIRTFFVFHLILTTISAGFYGLHGVLLFLTEDPSVSSMFHAVLNFFDITFRLFIGLLYTKYISAFYGTYSGLMSTNT